MVKNTLPRARLPRYVEDYWQGVDPAIWVGAAASRCIENPFVLPLTRLSGALVYPVLDERQVEGGVEFLDVVLVSVAPPRRALRQLAPLLAYGPCLVVLPPTSPQQFFDLAELDLRGVGVSQVREDGSVRLLVRPERHASIGTLAPWWRAKRQHQLLLLAGA